MRKMSVMRMSMMSWMARAAEVGKERDNFWGIRGGVFVVGERFL